MNGNVMANEEALRCLDFSVSMYRDEKFWVEGVSLKFWNSIVTEFYVLFYVQDGTSMCVIARHNAVNERECILSGGKRSKALLSTLVRFQRDGSIQKQQKLGRHGVKLLLPHYWQSSLNQWGVALAHMTTLASSFPTLTFSPHYSLSVYRENLPCSI
jgi:hypothetical protein